jgi:LPS-assembly protein
MARLALLLLLALAAPLAAAETPLNLEAADVQVTVEGGRRIALAKGEARFRGSDFLLTADEVRYDEEAETLTATGRVTFTRGEARLLADRLVYRRRDGSFAADRIRLGLPPYFAEGVSAEGSAREIIVHEARVTYGEPGPWQPTFTAKLVAFAPGERLRTEHASVGVGGIRPLSLPSFQHEFTRRIDASVAVDGGFRQSLGAFLDMEALAPVVPGGRIGADLGLYGSRGVMFGPAASYTSRQEPETLRGRLRTGYIRDHGDRKTDLLGNAIPVGRGYAEWQHQQALTPELTLGGQLMWWKDSEVLRDFRPRTFFPVQEPDSFLEATYRGANSFVSAFTRVQPNRFHRVQERLPELRFDLLPHSVGGGLYARGESSVAVLREDPVGPAGASLRSVRWDAYYGLLRPVALTDWFTFTPVVGGRVTHYGDREGPTGSIPGSYTRVLGEVGVDAALRASGTFDYRNPVWKIDGLRHLVTPRLSYRRIPGAERGSARIPAIDRETFATYLPTLGLSGNRSLDDLRPTDTLRLGVDNTLQTRDPALGARDLLSLNLAADLRFRRPASERDLSEVHAELAAQPARWLQVDLYQSVSPHSGRLREFNSGLTVRDGAAWSVRFSNNFLRSQLQDYHATARYRFTERFEALTRLHYDSRRRRFNEQVYGISQNVNNTWLLSYTVSLFSGRRRESSFGFNVQIDTIGF